jgi:hypothetical protein
MTKTTTSLPLTISLQIPTYWTPEQAFALFDLVNDLRDAIWQCYGAQLLDEYRGHFQSTAIDRVDKTPSDPPF